MKTLMEEIKARRHRPNTSRVGTSTSKEKGAGFWLIVLEGFSRKKLMKDEADRVEQQIQEVTEWIDSVDENTSFVEAACQNYEVLVDERQVGKDGGVGPSGIYNTRSRPRRDEDGSVNAHYNRGKGNAKLLSFRLCSEV